MWLKFQITVWYIFVFFICLWSKNSLKAITTGLANVPIRPFHSFFFYEKYYTIWTNYFCFVAFYSFWLYKTSLPITADCAYLTDASIAVSFLTKNRVHSAEYLMHITADCARRIVEPTYGRTKRNEFYSFAPLVRNQIKHCKKSRTERNECQTEQTNANTGLLRKNQEKFVYLVPTVFVKIKRIEQNFCYNLNLFPFYVC